MSLPIEYRQRDYCSVCYKRVHRYQLVKTQVQREKQVGSNYFLYSDYNSAEWTAADCTDAGAISVGANHALGARVSVSLSNVCTEVGGAKTWTGDGSITGTAKDVSSWSSAVFGVDVGPYQRSESPELTVALKLKTGASEQTLKTKTSKYHERLWATYDPSDLDSGLDASALVHFIEVTTANGTEKWWAENFTLEKDVTVPGTIIRTNGAAYDFTGHGSTVEVVKVCPECWERYIAPSKLIGRPRIEVEPDIIVDIQES